jgi:hypothetical protein
MVSPSMQDPNFQRNSPNPSNSAIHSTDPGATVTVIARPSTFILFLFKFHP